MSARFDQAIEKTKELSTHERAALARCLIFSLEQEHDEGVDAAWADLADRRTHEIESGKVETISWEDIKNRLKHSS